MCALFQGCAFRAQCLVVGLPMSFCAKEVVPSFLRGDEGEPTWFPVTWGDCVSEQPGCPRLCSLPF